MLTTIIVDDELNSRQTLRNLIVSFCPGTEILAMAGSAEEAVTLIRNHRPDLVFLDIEMPFQNGFDVLASFEAIDFEIIFTTAYSHYAIKAIKFSALDYLLKPINVAELREALSKVERKKQQSAFSPRHFEVFIENFKKTNNQLQKMIIRTLEGFEVVEVQDIIRCEGDNNYTRFFFTNKKSALVSKTMKEFEELLSDYHFLRVHQSHLININHVKKYVKGRGGYAEMSDGSIIDISRNKKDAFIEMFAIQV